MYQMYAYVPYSEHRGRDREYRIAPVDRKEQECNDR